MKYRYEITDLRNFVPGRDESNSDFKFTRFDGGDNTTKLKRALKDNFGCIGTFGPWGPINYQGNPVEGAFVYAKNFKTVVTEPKRDLGNGLVAMASVKRTPKNPPKIIKLPPPPEPKPGLPDVDPEALLPPSREEMLEKVIKTLLQYGNKDCTAQAESRLSELGINLHDLA